jgi:hypothetical protein
MVAQERKISVDRDGEKGAEDRRNLVKCGREGREGERVGGDGA